MDRLSGKGGGGGGGGGGKTVDIEFVEIFEVIETKLVGKGGAPGRSVEFPFRSRVRPLESMIDPPRIRSWSSDVVLNKDDVE